MKIRVCARIGLALPCWLMVIAGLAPQGLADSSPPDSAEFSLWGRQGPHEVAIIRSTWQDDTRRRQVPVKIFYPAQGAGPFPLVIFSHGLGGSREGYQYLGSHWASHGYVSVHLQHLGSDRAVWENSWLKLPALWRAAGKLENSLNRPLDVTFALDQLEILNQSESPFKGRLDLTRVGAAGHSFGAFTTLAAAGQVFKGQGGRERSLADPRLKAAIPMSAPVPRRREFLAQAYAKITIPCLHMTGTRDDSPIGGTSAADRRLPFDHMNGSDQYLVIFQDGDHMIFSGHQRRWSRDIKDARFHHLIRLGTTVFWEAYLKGDATAKDWLTSGGLARALEGDASLEVKLKDRAVPAPSQGQ